MFEVEAGADEKQQIKFVWPKGYWHILIFLIRHSLTDLRTNERAAITIDTNVAFDTFK